MQFSAPRIVTGVCFSSDSDVATTFAEWPHSLRARRTLTARAFVYTTML